MCRCRGRLFLLICLIALVTGALPVAAQLTSADFDRAINIQQKYRGLAVNVPEAPMWEEGTHRLLYRKTVEGGTQFMIYDADAQTKQPAFDHAKLADSLSKASGHDYKPLMLPFPRFRFTEKN